MALSLPDQITISSNKYFTPWHACFSNLYEICYKLKQNESTIDVKFNHIRDSVIQIFQECGKVCPYDVMEFNLKVQDLTKNLKDVDDANQRIQLIVQSSLFQLMKREIVPNSFYGFCKNYEAPGIFKLINEQYGQQLIDDCFHLSKDLLEWTANLRSSLYYLDRITFIPEVVLIDFYKKIINNQLTFCFHKTYQGIAIPRKNILISITDSGINLKKEAPYVYQIVSCFEEKFHPWVKELIAYYYLDFFDHNTPPDFIQIVELIKKNKPGLNDNLSELQKENLRLILYDLIVFKEKIKNATLNICGQNIIYFDFLLFLRFDSPLLIENETPVFLQELSNFPQEYQAELKSHLEFEARTLLKVACEEEKKCQIS